MDLVEREHPDVGVNAGLAASFAVLTRLWRRAPASVAAVLRDAQAGAWSAWCLRRLLGRVRGDVDLAVDLAYLGGFALAAARSVGVDAEAAVPVRAGWIIVPTLGRVRLGDAASFGVANASHASGRLRFEYGGRVVEFGFDGTAAQDSGWEPLCRLVVDDPERFAVTLDDISPYRRLFGRPPADRLDAVQQRWWQDMLAGAWQVLSYRHPGWAAAIGSTVTELVPLVPDSAGTGVSATARDAVGVVALAPPADPAGFAATLVHEVQHSRINALHDVTALYADAAGRSYYSPWRDDPRPLGGLLHGCVAFLGVADFWRVERAEPEHSEFAELEFALLAQQVRVGYRTLSRATGELTPAGRRVAASIGPVLRRWSAEPVAERSRRLARDLVADHAIAWRLRNLRPDPNLVARLVDAWTAESGRGAVTRTAGKRNGQTLADAGAAEPSTVLMAESSLRRLARSPRTGSAGHLPDGDEADRYLVDGDYRRAAVLYGLRIEHDAADTRAWIGLAISTDRAHDGETSLSRAPELLVALSQLVTPRPDPRELASWLDRHLPAGTGS
ncbi:HEXXH motif domain-containing protein [Dactylosporangium sp. NPDC049525]|uniref:HEXXH motif domain-containing protein n=1 Tax=Dactylosporangium sp. NPDC049525 TaxID=3154730 RepID=UPI0034284A5B